MRELERTNHIVEAILDCRAFKRGKARVVVYCAVGEPDACEFFWDDQLILQYTPSTFEVEDFRMPKTWFPSGVVRLVHEGARKRSRTTVATGGQ